MVERDLQIDGMTCASCVQRVDRLLRRVPGVAAVSVNLATGRARIVSDETTSLSGLIDSLKSGGYAASIPTVASKAAMFDRSTIRLAVAGLLACPFLLGMILSAASMPIMVQFLLASILQWGVAWPIHGAAIKALRHRQLTMDSLVSLGSTSAYGLSAVNVVRGHFETCYFESGALIVAFVVIGRWLEQRARVRVQSSVGNLLTLLPSDVSLWVDGVERRVPSELIGPGDRFVIRPGERVAADSIVEEGQGSLDLSAMTGESAPEWRQPGQKVLAGGLSVDGYFRVRAVAAPGQSQLQQIVALVESAQTARAGIERLVDRISRLFIPAVLLLSLVTLVCVGLTSTNWSTAILRAVAVMVMACPCAMGLAAPMAIIMGTGTAARHGILLKNASSFEQLGAVTQVAFDKTGTLTDGQFSVSAVVTARPSTDDRQLLAAAAGLAIYSEHALGRAILAEAVARDIVPAAVAQFHAEPGLGVCGVVDGQTVWMGRAEWSLAEATGEMRWDGHDRLAEFDGVPDPSDSLVWLAVGDRGNGRRCWGLLAMRDGVKPGAALAVRQLQRSGVAVSLLTGDRVAVARRVGEQLGIADIHASLLPIDKVALLKAMRKAHAILAMVGDGVNDAPALAVADLGIAMGRGSDLARQAADVILLRDDPALVPLAIAIARRTGQKIRQGLIWAFFYNALALPMAVSGALTPALAGLAMALSSLSVVTNALVGWKKISTNSGLPY